MNVARILYPVRTLGPGNRIGIWLCGCHRACPGCSNPELWEPRSEYEISAKALMQLIHRIADAHPVDGFTISGGEPMNQASALCDILPELRIISSDILVYSGYTLDELHGLQSDSVEKALSQIAVLIDGAYLEARNTNALLRGSDNQKIRVLNEQLSEKYAAYLQSAHNQVQNFTGRDGVISVGIHRPGFMNALIDGMRDMETNR